MRCFVRVFAAASVVVAAAAAVAAAATQLAWRQCIVARDCGFFSLGALCVAARDLCAYNHAL